MNVRLKSKSLIELTPADSARSYRSPSARRRANYSVLVCRWHGALYLYYRRICYEFDTGLPPTQASERRPRVSQQMHVRRPSLFFDVVIPTEKPNPRIWTTWLRSCLYRLVEPLTIKTVKNDPIVNNDKQCIPVSSQVSNLFLPKLPCTRL